ncbi:MAG: peptide-methionine (S)-S-oxide reductase MsrA [Candidatus Thiodiazotropha sp. (ex Epidulcina cf. delphinae)]|nr:peptide-methionine (S)-S-oxide reductase MsrA [Candidatus Thiodiazotropha sp. (ex Epidulcina cf. delphinae)]
MIIRSLVVLACLSATLFFVRSALMTDTEARPIPDNLAIATFAGGCFWCIESDFEKSAGVAKAISGYSGGKKKDPSYRQVSSGATEHLESVEVHYDPAILSYEALLQAFWRMIDPTDPGGQFSDRGYQYSTAIFYHTEEQRIAAEKSLKSLDASGRYDKPIVTQIRRVGIFYPAESHHQDYYRHNPLRYRVYRWNSGRDQFLKTAWGEETLHK